MTEIGGSPTAKRQCPLLLLLTGTADFCSEGWQPRFPLERHAIHRPLNRNRRKCHRARYARSTVTSLASSVPKKGARHALRSRGFLLTLSTRTADFCSEGWQPRFPLERHAIHRPLNRNRRKCHRAGYVSRQVTSLASTVPKTGASLDIPFRGCESPGRGARSYAAKGAEGIG